MNKNQKIILAIFIPIIISFIALVIAKNLGYTTITREVPENSIWRTFGATINRHEGNPFDWENTWYIWVLYLIFCCIFEYKLFADKKANVNRKYIQK